MSNYDKKKIAIVEKSSEILAILDVYKRQDFIISRYEKKYTTLQVGTGDSPMTVPFYEKCGFVRSHEIKDFFIENYDHPISEACLLYTSRCVSETASRKRCF